MNGKIVWFEVMGRDAAKLQAFYSNVFGWDLTPAPGTDAYGLVSCPQGGIPGGIGQAPVGPGWTTFYVQVEDLDASIEQAESLGATVVSPPTRLPHGDSIALLSDPEGHTIGLVKTAA